MKNYQKILFPCTAALILSLSAFVSADESSSLESVKEQSTNETKLLYAKGTDGANSYDIFVTGTTSGTVRNVVVTKAFEEGKVVTAVMNSKILDIESIVISYK